MHLTRTNVRELLDRHGLQPSRALGQNFLCDPNTIDKIVRLAGVEAGDRVIEIGPGLGSLTLGLLAAGAKVTAVEIDQYVLRALREVVAGHDATIVHGDALNLDWGPLLGTDDWSVIANLPYNVATPLVLDLLRDQPSLVRWLVMVQREVGERLAAEPGTSACGIPSVLRGWSDRFPPRFSCPSRESSQCWSGSIAPSDPRSMPTSSVWRRWCEPDSVSGERCCEEACRPTCRRTTSKAAMFARPTEPSSLICPRGAGLHAANQQTATTPNVRR